MTRYRAFVIHLTAASLILAIVLGSIILQFYPDFYFFAEGGWAAIKIVIAVDLVLGPLLTLIIFKPGKKGLKLDLTIIALLQLCALIYGSYILYSERPAYLVFSIDRFEVATAADVDYSGFSNQQLATGAFSKPKIVYAEPPVGAESQQLLREVLGGGKDLYLRARYYRDFSENIKFTVAKRLDETQLFSKPEDLLILLDFLQHYGGSKSDYMFYPLVGNSHSILAVVNRQTGELMTALKIDPWNVSTQAINQ
jgi:hypothetical protein